MLETPSTQETTAGTTEPVVLPSRSQAEDRVMVRSESWVKAPLEMRDPGPHPPRSSPGTGQEGLHQLGHRRQTKPRGPSPPTGLSRVSAPRQARSGGLGSWGPPTWSPAAVPGLSGQRPARAGTSQTRSGLPLEAPSVKGEREFPLKLISSEKLLTKTARRPPSPGRDQVSAAPTQSEGRASLGGPARGGSTGSCAS